MIKKIIAETRAELIQRDRVEVEQFRRKVVTIFCLIVFGLTVATPNTLFWLCFILSFFFCGMWVIIQVIPHRRDER